MNLIQKILQSPLMVAQPLVLIDIGASGAIHPIWKQIAPYSTCIAFDADDRDFDPNRSEKKSFQRLLIKNSLVSDTISKDQPFYLTASPHCSSLLKPNKNSLANWSYAPFFEVTKTLYFNTTTIEATLQEFGIDYIDWYKSDSQGIDLRLFNSLPENIRNGITVAEFEPGIVDAYEGEDKLKDMLQYQEEKNTFWLANLKVKGRVRMPAAAFQQLVPNGFLQKVLSQIGPIAPGWAEMTYLNACKSPETHSERALMVGWIAASLIKQHGFAFTLAEKGLELYGGNLFSEMKACSARKMQGSFFTFKYFSWLKEKLGN